MAGADNQYGKKAAGSEVFSRLAKKRQGG